MTPPPPPGPVFAFITSSDPAAPVNALMKKRAFEVYDWIFNGLPQKSDEFFEPVPAPAPAPAPAKPASSEPAAPAAPPAPAPAKP